MPAAILVALGLCMPAGSVSAQSDFECPVQIGYLSASPCNSLPPAGFFMRFEQPYLGSTQVQIDFGTSDPNCQSLFLSHGPPICEYKWLMDTHAPPCTIEHPTGTVTFSENNKVCHYIDGLLDHGISTGCDELITNCAQPLVEFARDFIPVDGDCKFWEGPCASGSEIWRGGQVVLGTDRSPQGEYLLAVKGGITTEMLQICKPEWCDYVFDDTFHLMPLSEVKAFIQANGYLPGCTPESLIQAQDGFYLDTEAVHQQQKIEEIFLHLINLQKRIDRLNGKVNALGGLAPGQPREDHDVSPKAPNAKLALPDEQPEVVTEIRCFVINPAQPGQSNGVGGIRITPYGGPYAVIWAGPSGGQLSGVDCAEVIKIPNLPGGNYSVTVSNGSGVLGTCTFSIGTGVALSDCSVFSDPDCRQAVLQLLEQEAFDEPSSCTQWEGDPCSHSGNIYRLGNVGIGTSVLKPGYSLAVKGGIATDRFRVELCESAGWCDYVFDPEYLLPTLLEVEAFIKSNRHLPGMISQNEVTHAGGFDLRATKLDQQEKIEEAFLYLIQLNKRKKNLDEHFHQLIQSH